MKFIELIGKDVNECVFVIVQACDRYVVGFILKNADGTKDAKKLP